jgi:multidrug resistance protein
MKASEMEKQRSLLSDVFSIYVPSFFIFLGMSIVSPILPLYAETFNISFTLVSLAISMYALGRFIFDIPVGLLADRFGRKLLMTLGTLLITVTSFLNATAAYYWEFLLYRLLEGAGSAMWITSRQTLLADMLKPGERGRIMSYFQSFMLIGSAVGPITGGFVATVWGLRAPFYFYSLAGLISLILTVRFVREPKDFLEGGRDNRQFSLIVVKRLFHNRNFMMASLSSFTAFFLMTGVRSTMIPLYSDSVLGLNELDIGTVISYATLMNLIMTVPLGYSIDYFGRKPIILISLAVTATASLIFPSTYDYLTISMAAVLLGLGTSGCQQAPLAMVTDASIDEPHGLSMGLYRFIGDIGFALGPIIVGIIADAYGLRMPFYVVSALIFVNTASVFLFATETYSARQAKNSGEKS